MALSLTLTCPTVQELHATALAASQAGDQAAVRRCLAVVDYAAHRSVALAAAAVGGHADSGYTWLHTLLTTGAAGGRSAPKAERPPKLRGEQQARLQELWLTGPEAAGYPGAAGTARWSPH